jgi:hypothetical protein
VTAVLAIAGLVLVLTFYLAVLVFLVRDRRGTAGPGWVSFPFITAIVGVAMMAVGALTRQWALIAAGYAGAFVFGGPTALAIVRGWREEVRRREAGSISD